MAGRHQRHTSRDVLLSVGGGAVAGAQPLGRYFYGATFRYAGDRERRVALSLDSSAASS